MQRLPVTILSGFLGAGKTTLLNHILKESNHLKFAVIVNDLADVNIDAALILNADGVRNGTKIIELHNGCICCSLREDLVEEIERLALSGDFDYLLVEATGVSEPLPVAQAFLLASGAERTLNDVAFLDTAVTVVDANSFMSAMAEAAPVEDDNAGRNVADLLVDQVEFADVLLINKVDRVSPDQLRRLQGALRSLNPRAAISEVLHGQAEIETIINARRFSLEAAQKAPGWLASMRNVTDHPSEVNEFGIANVVWRARRPVHPMRFWKFIEGDWTYGTLLRSKGFFWLANRYDCIGLWHQAGGAMRHEYAGRWWASVPESDWPNDTDVLASIRAKWVPGVGDRRQEIVFIGQNLQSDKLLAALDACLLTDAEMFGGASSWQRMADPFPSWSSPAQSGTEAAWNKLADHREQEFAAGITRYDKGGKREAGSQPL